MESEDGSLTPTEVTTGRTVGREVEILAGLTAGQHVVSSGAFLVDAESNLGALTAGMDMEEDAIDHSEHDMGGAPMDDTMDHSEHEMGGAPMDDAMDHSGHEMAPDSAPAGGAGGHVHE